MEVRRAGESKGRSHFGGRSVRRDGKVITRGNKDPKLRVLQHKEVSLFFNNNNYYY